MQKITLYHLFLIEIQSILESITRLTTPIFDHGHPKNFQATVTCMNLYQHAENWLITSVDFSDTVSLRV